MTIIIGLDPHKASNTIAVLDGDVVVFNHRYPNTDTGISDMITAVTAWPQRRWAVEGAHGIGLFVAQRSSPPARRWSMSPRNWPPVSGFTRPGMDAKPTAILDQSGQRSPLYSTTDVDRAVREPKLVRPLVDALVADLVVSAGRRPAVAMHLAGRSGQPASVISLVEERLRRNEPNRSAVRDTRSSRGLTLMAASRQLRCRWPCRAGVVEEGRGSVIRRRQRL
jgi:hypothetical protein